MSLVQTKTPLFAFLLSLMVLVHFLGSTALPASTPLMLDTNRRPGSQEQPRDRKVMEVLSRTLREASRIGSSRSNGVSSTTSTKFSMAHFEFTLDLYLAMVNVVDGNDGNIIFSPVSVATVLAPLLLTAEWTSQIAQQLKQVLHYSDLTQEEVADIQVTLLSTLDHRYYHRSLRTAITILLQKGVAIGEIEELNRYLDDGVHEMDFGNHSSSLSFVNQLVWRETRGSVDNTLISAPPVEAVALAVVAVFFSGQWLQKFDHNLTFDKGLFYLNTEDRFEIPMMVGKYKLPLGYDPELEVRILELPYEDKRVSMFILLPDHPDHGLSHIEANMTSENIKSLFSTLKEETVNLRLPRFRVDVTPPLSAALQSLGLTEVIAPSWNGESEASADDARSYNSNSALHLSDVVHRVVLEVRESGGEISRSTSMVNEQVGTFRDKYFEVDHPFIFFLWDYISSSILVMGRVVRPTPIIDT